MVAAITDGLGGIHGSYYGDEAEQYLYQDFYFAGEPTKGPEITIASLARVRPNSRAPDRVVPRSSGFSNKSSIAGKLVGGALAILLLPLIIINIVTFGLLP